MWCSPIANLLRKNWEMWSLWWPPTSPLLRWGKMARSLPGVKHYKGAIVTWLQGSVGFDLIGFDCIPHWLDEWCILPLIHIDTSEVFIRFPLRMVTQWIVCSWKAIHGYPGYQLFVKSAPKCLKGLPWAVTPPSELSQVEKCKGTCITWRFLVALLRHLFWRLRLTVIEQCFVHSALLLISFAFPRLIRPSSAAFAALRHDGTVVTWGDPERGGNSSAVFWQMFGWRRLMVDDAHGAVKTLYPQDTLGS